MLNIFSCVYWLPVCLFCRNICLDLPCAFLIGLLIFLMLWCMSCLYILDINPLSVQFAIYFHHSEGCLLILLIVSFAVQKLLSLIKSHLLIFHLFLQEVGQRGSCCDQAVIFKQREIFLSIHRFYLHIFSLKLGIILGDEVGQCHTFFGIFYRLYKKFSEIN